MFTSRLAHVVETSQESTLAIRYRFALNHKNLLRFLLFNSPKHCWSRNFVLLLFTYDRQFEESTFILNTKYSFRLLFGKENYETNRKRFAVVFIYEKKNASCFHLCWTLVHSKFVRNIRLFKKHHQHHHQQQQQQ